MDYVYLAHSTSSGAAANILKDGMISYNTIGKNNQTVCIADGVFCNVLSECVLSRIGHQKLHANLWGNVLFIVKTHKGEKYPFYNCNGCSHSETGKLASNTQLSSLACARIAEGDNMLPWTLTHEVKMTRDIKLNEVIAIVVTNRRALRIIEAKLCKRKEWGTIKLCYVHRYNGTLGEILSLV